MNKTELIAAIAKESDISQQKAKEVLNAFIDTITNTLASGDAINIVGFGSFVTVKREARMGRNPKTGKEMKIAASTTPKFKAGKSLKDAVSAEKKGKKKK